MSGPEGWHTVTPRIVVRDAGQLDVVANEAYAVALFRGRAERDGKTLDNPTCLRMRIVDGRVVEVWEFVWDLFAVDEFWS